VPEPLLACGGRQVLVVSGHLGAVSAPRLSGTHPQKNGDLPNKGCPPNWAHNRIPLRVIFLPVHIRPSFSITDMRKVIPLRVIFLPVHIRPSFSITDMRKVCVLSTFFHRSPFQALEQSLSHPRFPRFSISGIEISLALLMCRSEACENAAFR